MLEIKREMIPLEVMEIMEMLEQEGFCAYIVGGCVRDMMLGITPKDYDICTSATPDEVKCVFGSKRVAPTGIKYGTVIIVMDDGAYEITSFRKESGYADNRHPEQVSFTRSIREDLSRRDFTINAMAYSPKDGLIDLYGGKGDLAAGILRCVGSPIKRFQEDALRVMRALRFAANYNLSIHKDTDRAVRLCTCNLASVSRERITAELLSMLEKAEKPGEMLYKYKEVLFEIIPDIKVCNGFNQNSPWHSLDVLEHTIAVVDGIDNTMLTECELATTRLAAILHDIGKPGSYTVDAKTGNGHFYHHWNLSAELTEKICTESLKVTKQMRKTVINLVNNHDARHMSVKKMMNKFGVRESLMLLKLQYADAMAGGDIDEKYAARRQEDAEHIIQAEAELFAAVEKQEVFSIKNLAINGHDLKVLGFKPGPLYTTIMNYLLDNVVEGRIKNENSVLMEETRTRFADLLR